MKKSELIKALEIVKPGLANRDVIEQTTSFAFMGGHVVTYNNEISIKHPVEGLEIEGAIHADEMYNLLKKIKGDEFEIQINEAEIIIISGKAKASMTRHAEIKLPLEEIVIGKWKTIPDGFLTAIRMAALSCSNNSSEIVTCVHVNENGYIEGTDNHRITRYQLDGGMPVKTFLIPSGSVSEVWKLNPKKIAEGKGWIHFQTDEGTVLSCRIFEDKFPDTSNVMKIKGKPISLPKTLPDILDRASVFLKDAVIPVVYITLADNRMTVKSQGQSGSYEESANVKYRDEPIEFSIKPEMLKTILVETQECQFTSNLLRFEGANWVYIAALSK